MSDYLIDTNVLVRLVLPQDPLNPAAAGAVDELKRRGEKTCIAAQNLIEFWSVATRPVEVNGLGMTVEKVNSEIERIEKMFRVLDDFASVYKRCHLAFRPGTSGARCTARGTDAGAQDRKYLDLQRRRLRALLRDRRGESPISQRCKDVECGIINGVRFHLEARYRDFRKKQFDKLVLRTLQNWERQRTQPTGPTRALLKIVASNPKAIEALHGYAPALGRCEGQARCDYRRGCECDTVLKEDMEPQINADKHR